MKKNLLFVAGMLLNYILVAGPNSKRVCGSMENLQRLEAEDPSLAARLQQIESQTNAYLLNNNSQNHNNAIVTIPVVFHIVYSSTSQNISDAQCQAQLDQLNLDYARLNADASNTPSVWQNVAVNTNIQFCLAQRDPSGNASTGIERKSTTTSSFSTNDNVKKTANGGLAAWDATKYLNIWSCNLSGGVLGYAQFPGGSASTDGVVLLYSSIGSVQRPGLSSIAPYNLGRTATHEVGHWLNLYHIWGDDGTSCSGTDNVGDTPNQAGENYGCPTFPETDGCSTTSPGVMFMNYMDYTDDACMNMFTSGQSSRMNALFATGGARAGILTSLGCVAPSGATCGVPSGLSSSSVTATSAIVSWTAVSGAASYNLQYKLSSASTFTTVNTTSPSYSLSSLTSSSSYVFQVQTVCSSGSSAYSATSSFNTSAAASCGVPSGLASSSITTSSASLTWTAVSGATSYNVEYKLTSASTFTSVNAISNSLALSGLGASSNYTYAIQSICSSGSSAYSATANFTTASSGCSDQYESNNSKSNAKTIAVNTDITALIGSNGDNDWFKFTTVSPNTRIKITLTNVAGDYDIRLYNSSSSQLGISQNNGTTSETIIRNTSSSATYYIYVYGYNGAFSASQCYNLRVNVSSTNFKTSEDTDEDLIAPSINSLEVYPNPAHDQISAMYNSSVSETMNLRIFDMVGKSVFETPEMVTEGNNKFSIDLSAMTRGIYFMEFSNSSARIVKKFIVQ